MPWAAIEHIDDEMGEETVHIVPYLEVPNAFETREEAEAFGAIREAAQDSVTDDDDFIIGIHKGHTLTPDCACDPKPMESDPYFYVHNAAN